MATTYNKTSSIKPSTSGLKPKDQNLDISVIKSELLKYIGIYLQMVKHIPPEYVYNLSDRERTLLNQFALIMHEQHPHIFKLKKDRHENEQAS